MDSYSAAPWQPVVRTTGGDPEKLAATLQSYDLRTPHRRVYLNNFQIHFIEKVVEGVKLYLPLGLYRARGEWRIRIFHAEGIAIDSVTDAEAAGDWNESLKMAWQYFISELRHLKAPGPENRRPAKNAILETGIRAVNVNGYGKMSKRYGCARWRFTLGISQVEPNGQERRSVVGTWALSKVTDEQIRNDLRRAAAMSNYRYHLLDAGATLEEAYLAKDSSIPAEYWPEDPPCIITADDLWYFAEQRQGAPVG
ncbi:hypothetical protein AQ621_16530 (plasmid) [Marinobacter sp. P4B1]|nr:hypothetical protein AQ621_16530 [Marinobacter sp. P4B1]